MIAASGTPFRDLFIELPRAVFEVLQGIGEAVVADALRSPATNRAAAPRPQRSSSLFSDRHIRLVLQRYDWTHAELERAVADDTLVLVVQRECLHWQRYKFHANEIAACHAPREEVELLDRVVERTNRRCYCVQREAVS